ncbi:myb-binding protein 1A-like protein [Helicoverpa armigera]|uniref:myb-binding protein 1A-like protein n=1 Tax=Helicoverpa armigera TaxID=29058 RepID=UPI0030836B5A
MKEETESTVAVKENKVTASVLDAFDLLKEPKDDVKLNGASKIISQLQGSENEKDLQYVLKRLVRSLGANLPDMRTGYFATLVALLSNFDDVTIAQLLELVKKELHSNGSSKSEVGDVALGQILVCGAIFRSKMFLKCTSEEQTQVIQLLLAAGKKKSYLSTVAYLILLDLINVVDAEQFGTLIWPLIKQDFKKDIKEHTLDSLYFLMMVNDKFPAKIKLRKLIGVTEILCDDNIQPICEKIMAGIDFNSLGHPIFKEIGKNIANSPHLQEFWTGIDSQLVKHNRNRELVAINILTTILNNITENVNVIPVLISRNFFKLFMDWFKGLQTASKIRSKRDNEDDNKIMIKKQKELLNALAKALKSDKVDDSIRIDILKKLLFNPGEMNFTEITGTSVVKALISDLKEDGVKKMAKLLKGVLLNTSKKVLKEDVERNWYNNERVKAAELISHLVSHEAVKDDTELKLTYMKLLMCFGFFKIGGDESVAVSIELSGSIKSCFYRCFTSRFSNVDSLVTVLSSLSSFICGILQKEQVKTKIEKQFPKENMECWDMLMEVCQNIEKNDTKSKVDKVFLVLLYQLGLFLFSEPVHVKIARSSIKELKSCYEHYRKGKKKKSKPVKEGDISSDPEWIEVLVEVLLSILSAESSVLRSVVQCVFRLLWEYLTPSSVGQIVSVLDPENESNPLTNEDSDSENEDDDMEGKENGKESEDENEEEDDSESDDEDDDEDGDDDEMRTPDQLRLAVQKALGAAALESDAESVDADMIDEEEGKKLDEALAEAFKQFHQGKGKKSKKDRKDKKALSDFRIRVLDLIDIYLEKDPSMDICLGMIAPLTRCLEFCIQDSQFSELENRVRKTIKALAKVRKFSSTDDIDINILCDHLKATIDKGARSHFLFQALGDVITFFATFIIHCSLKIVTKTQKSPKKSKAVSPLVEIFKESLQSYFQNRNCMLPIIFFHNVLQAEWSGSYELVPITIENAFNNNVRQFRRNEGLELIAGFYRCLKARAKSASSEIDMKALQSIEANFENTLTKSLKGDAECTVKNNFFNTLKKVINTMQQFHESCHIESKLEFKTLLEVVGSCKPAKTNNSKQEQVNHNQQNNNNKKTKKNKKKRKAEQVNGNVEPRKKKAKKISESE